MFVKTANDKTYVDKLRYSAGILFVSQCDIRCTSDAEKLATAKQLTW